MSKKPDVPRESRQEERKIPEQTQDTESRERAARRVAGDQSYCYNVAAEIAGKITMHRDALIGALRKRLARLQTLQVEDRGQLAFLIKRYGDLEKCLLNQRRKLDALGTDTPSVYLKELQQQMQRLKNSKKLLTFLNLVNNGAFQQNLPADCSTA